MTRIAFALLLVVAGCKSSEKSSGGTPSPTPSAAPVADQPEPPETPPPAPEEPANMLKAGAPVEKGWSEGGPGEVVWKVEGGAAVTLKAEAGKPEGTLLAVHQNKQQHVTNFPCDVASEGSQASFALTPEGKVLFRAANGPAGKKPAMAAAFLLEWKPDKGTVGVAKSWMGRGADEPPPWAKL